jgi:hypothetical protein
VERHLNNNREKNDRRKEHGKKKSFAAARADQAGVASDRKQSDREGL